ncbi:MAG: hypothetical protein H6836_03025 [Planctomycetes bacterium]|nr:hypothetical protein [Planctomycetota bacterium]MCB9888525.1 hypothetical protein [Planctomycetota bacterium]
MRSAHALLLFCIACAAPKPLVFGADLAAARERARAAQQLVVVQFEDPAVRTRQRDAWVDQRVIEVARGFALVRVPVEAAEPQQFQEMFDAPPGAALGVLDGDGLVVATRLGVPRPETLVEVLQRVRSGYAALHAAAAARSAARGTDVTEPVFRLAVAYRDAGNAVAARRHLKLVAFSRHPRLAVTACVELVRLEVASGNAAEARNWLEQVQAADPQGRIVPRQQVAALQATIAHLAATPHDHAHGGHTHDHSHDGHDGHSHDGHSHDAHTRDRVPERR